MSGKSQRQQVQGGTTPTRATGSDPTETRAVAMTSEGWRQVQMDQTQRGTVTEALLPSMASPRSQACERTPATFDPVAVGV